MTRSALVPLVIRAHGTIEDRLGRSFYSTPAWDMLIDLYSREREAAMQVTSLSMATKAPARTAQRTIERLVQRELLIRTTNAEDRRRSMVTLSPRGIETLDQLFDELWTLIVRVADRSASTNGGGSA
jgi:DNA-binding MarR family transcriptional regulator